MKIDATINVHYARKKIRGPREKKISLLGLAAACLAISSRGGHGSCPAQRGNRGSGYTGPNFHKAQKNQEINKVCKSLNFGGSGKIPATAATVPKCGPFLESDAKGSLKYVSIPNCFSE